MLGSSLVPGIIVWSRATVVPGAFVRRIVPAAPENKTTGPVPNSVHWLIAFWKAKTLDVIWKRSAGGAAVAAAAPP